MYHSIRCRWVVAPVMFIVVLAACSAPLPSATVTGDAPTEVPGESVFETLCATCHGEQGVGGRAPALSGHTTDQVLRQVRAPVGEMPMFSSERLTEFGLAQVASYVVNLPEADVVHDAHGGGLSKQEAGEIVHILLSRALHNQDSELAAHYSTDAQQNMIGNHLDAMIGIGSDVNEGNFDAALEGVEVMLVASSASTNSSDTALITQLTHGAATSEDMASTEHWLAHLLSFDDLQVDVAALEEALSDGDLEGIAELLAPSSTDLDHDEAADDAHDDPAPHDEGDPADMEDEAADHEGDMTDADHEEDADETEVDAHDEGVAPDHDDTGAEPHDD